MATRRFVLSEPRSILADRHLIRSAEAYREADDRALAALKAALQPERMVGWNHGGQIRYGRVVEVLGLSYAHAFIRIRSDVSGKVYDVDKYPIMKWLGAT